MAARVRRDAGPERARSAGAAARAARAPLTRERVLHEAAQLADDGGFEALTMRGLAQRLGVQAMSLYNHIADKADLRDGIVDLVLGEVEAPVPGADWRAQLWRGAVSMYEVFRRHPWASRQMMFTRAVSPGRIRWMEGMLATLRQAGCSPSLAHHFYHAFDAHTTGFALWQANFPFSGPDLAERARQFASQIGGDYPYLLEHMHEHSSRAEPGAQSEFEFGLEMILDGVERLRDQTAQRPSRRRGRTV
jgi:AcrR family transcriptional regulator